MNNVIEEYLALVERTVYTNDIFAYQELEQLEEDYPELADATQSGTTTRTTSGTSTTDARGSSTQSTPSTTTHGSCAG
jgi:hypothetical protein